MAQVPQPALPNTDSVITCFPDTAGYARLTVGSSGRMYTSVQTAIDAAQLGSVIIIDAGYVTQGTLTLRNKSAGNGWIIITSASAQLLPQSNGRVQPTDAAYMPRCITTNTSGLPAIQTEQGAHHYRLVGLEITASNNVLTSYGLMFLGSLGALQTRLSEVPHHLIVDRCYIHGHDEGTIMKFGLRLDCANAAVIDSYISGFHSIGYDAQAIAGVNGPGPFKIINNYLEASGENILFGGGAPSIPGLVPSDIEIRKNTLYKPMSWRVGSATYAGKHWTIKNLFELKTGKRVLFDGNQLENSWADVPIGQSGYAILLTVRTEGGQSPQADVSDVTITNNVIKNAGAGITLSGTDDLPGNRSSRIRIANNRFENISGPLYGDGNVNGPNDGTFIKIGDPENVTIEENTIEQTGPITWAFKKMNGFVFVGNRVNCFRSAAGYQGMYGPGKTEGNASMAFFFPDLTDANRRFDGNALIGGTATRYSNYAAVSNNVFPATVSSAILKYGANQSAIDSAFNKKTICETPTAVYEVSEQEEVHATPNPTSENVFVTFPSNATSTYVLYDISGRALLNGSNMLGTQQINLGALPIGGYTLVVSTAQHIQTLPIWVIR